jgi:hypothetical protein
LIRAESEGDGKLGMFMAGNAGVSLVRAECLDFRDLTLLTREFSKSRADLKLQKRVIIIRMQGKAVLIWPKKAPAVKDFIRQPIPFGFSDLSENVRVPGITRIQEGSNRLFLFAYSSKLS